MNHIKIISYILENKNDEDFITKINDICTTKIAEQKCIELTTFFRKYIISEGKNNIAENFNILTYKFNNIERYLERTFVCTIYKLKICISYIGGDDFADGCNLTIDDIDINENFCKNDVITIEKIQNKLVENNINMKFSEFVDFINEIFYCNCEFNSYRR